MHSIIETAKLVPWKNVQGYEITFVILTDRQGLIQKEPLLFYNITSASPFSMHSYLQYQLNSSQRGQTTQSSLITNEIYDI